MIRFINFVLYSNIYIAICALAMTIQSLLILEKDIQTSPALLGLVFFSTLVIYALHRLVSLNKVDTSLEVKRFDVIGKYKSHIQIYALLSVLGGAVCFFYLQWETQLALVLPAVLSLGYVIPFLGNKKLRLRDLHFVKIFLIAIVWAYVTVLLPALEHEVALDLSLFGMLLERALFIFAITLPFDLRDWEIDKHNNVKTIPAVIGVPNTMRLAMLVLVVWMSICGVTYPVWVWPALAVSGLTTAYFIYRSPAQQHDYYFTALIDGTMWIQAILVLLFKTIC